ncbi:MAG: anaerobic sulfatase maturase [Clostridia bacterium]
MPPLSMMIKPVSSACNLRCKYCFYCDVSNHRETACYGKMEGTTLRALVRRAFIYADGSVSFAFQGGEPLLAGLGFYQEFLALVKEYNTRSLPVSYALQTNALTLDDEMAELFHHNNFLLGVSLDGCRETHDALRIDADGHGSYERALEGIALLRRHKVAFNILCVVTRQVAQQVDAVWKELAPYGFVQFIPCIDGFDGEKSEFSINSEEYGQFLTRCFLLYEAAYRAGQPVSVRNFDNYLGLLLGQQPELCGMSGRCGLYFLVESDGGVYPCDFYVLDEWRLGNVNDTSLARMAKSEVSNRFRDLSLRLPERCAACEWRALCRGGCRRDREPFVGDTPGENRFCESYRTFFSQCGTTLTLLAKRIKEQNQRG